MPNGNSLGKPPGPPTPCQTAPPGEAPRALDAMPNEGTPGARRQARRDLLEEAPGAVDTMPNGTSGKPPRAPDAMPN